MSKSTCTIGECERKVVARGMCNLHYQRERRGIPLDNPIITVTKNPPAECTIEGCDRPYESSGMCQMHYSRARRGKSFDDYVKGSLTQCTIGDCERPHMAKGMCQMHYYRSKNGTDLHMPVRQFGRYINCIVGNCERPHYARGMCSTHDRQRNKTIRSSNGFHQSRAREYGVPYEDVHDLDVFKRDEWKCGVCAGEVNPAFTHGHPMMAVIDHVVPLSRGGGHLVSNTQCAHYACNAWKHDRLQSELDELMWIPEPSAS